MEYVLVGENTAMNSSYESADLILKLYDLRREEVMRKARDWYLKEFQNNRSCAFCAFCG